VSEWGLVCISHIIALVFELFQNCHSRILVPVALCICRLQTLSGIGRGWKCHELKRHCCWRYPWFLPWFTFLIHCHFDTKIFLKIYFYIFYIIFNIIILNINFKILKILI
jgi:hypothetical protein